MMTEVPNDGDLLCRVAQLLWSEACHPASARWKLHPADEGCREEPRLAVGYVRPTQLFSTPRD